MTTNHSEEGVNTYYSNDNAADDRHITPTTNQRIPRKSNFYDESEVADLEQPSTETMTPSMSYVIHNLPHATMNSETTPQTTSTNTLEQITEIPGRLPLLLDTGSVNNLAGREWVTRAIQLATEAAQPEIENITREKPLEISGVGTNSLQCRTDVRLPITIQDIHGENFSYTFTAPVIVEPSSTFTQLPALLGSEALIQLGAILDFRSMRAHFAGPIDIDGRDADTYTEDLPTGARTFELQQTSTGHVMRPCISDLAATNPSREPSTTNFPPL